MPAGRAAEREGPRNARGHRDPARSARNRSRPDEQDRRQAGRPETARRRGHAAVGRLPGPAGVQSTWRSHGSRSVPAAQPAGRAVDPDRERQAAGRGRRASRPARGRDRRRSRTPAGRTTAALAGRRRVRRAESEDRAGSCRSGAGDRPRRLPGRSPRSMRDCPRRWRRQKPESGLQRHAAGSHYRSGTARRHLPRWCAATRRRQVGRSRAKRESNNCGGRPGTASLERRAVEAAVQPGTACCQRHHLSNSAPRATDDLEQRVNGSRREHGWACPRPGSPRPPRPRGAPRDTLAAARRIEARRRRGRRSTPSQRHCSKPSPLWCLRPSTRPPAWSGAPPTTTTDLGDGLQPVRRAGKAISCTPLAPAGYRSGGGAGPPGLAGRVGSSVGRAGELIRSTGACRLTCSAG